MKFNELKRLLIEDKYLKKWTSQGLRRYSTETNKLISKTWTWNEDGTVNVNGDVKINLESVDKLPVKFKKVEGSFNCSNCQLEIDENLPDYIGINFYNLPVILNQKEYQKYRKDLKKYHSELTGIWE